MKYKVGDRVRIKSLDWYNENKDRFNEVKCGASIFIPPMTTHCGYIRTISKIFEIQKVYHILEDNNLYTWTDEMIEGLVEEGTKSEPKFHIGDWATDGDVLAEDSCIFIIQKLGDNGTAAKTYCALHNDGYFENGSILYFDIDSTKPATEEEKQKLFKAIKDNGYKWNPETKTLEKLIEPLDVPTMTTDFVKEHGLPCPEGYIFKDENGNVINATKIVLEKKKKEYPKTYEECCKVLGVNPDNFLSIRNLYRDDGDEESTDYERDLLGKFDSLWELRICRDAYWKIAGEKMGLEKPWEPDWIDGEWKWCVCYSNNNIEFDSYKSIHHTFSFPTEEMRDAFYEAFRKEIEICKELL